MGFGYLFLGYLCAFLLKVTADIQPLGAGALAVLLGIVLMAVGVRKLSAYESAFRFSYFPLGLLLIENCYRLIGMVCAWIGQKPAWMTTTVDSAVAWVEFAIILAVHAVLFPAIMRLALSVDLRKTANAAIRDLVFVGLWGILYLVWALAPMPQDWKNAFFRIQVIVNLLVILFNLALLLSCMKNIAPEEDADQAPHRYRWNFLNRVGDRFFGEHERAAEKKKMETEAFLRRRKERKEERKNRK